MIFIKYMGSKSRVKKHIVPILQDIIDSNGVENYIEPFVGGANVIDAIKCNNKIGYDNHEYLIELFNKFQEDANCLPLEVSRDHYIEVRSCFNDKLNTFPKWYTGAVGFLASYNGRWFDGGYSGKRIVGTGKERDYFDEAKRNLQSQRDSILDVTFRHSDYRDIKILENSLVYCDIPYQNTKKYSTSKGFDYDEFWDWARQTSDNAIVIVSEQVAPKDFRSVWEQEVKRTIDNNKRVKSTEKLFTICDAY